MSNKKQKELLIIPAYNEETNILNTCKKIEKSKIKVDYIIIYAGPKDSTNEICRKNKLPCINLVHNLGIGGAVQTGYKYVLEHDYDIAIRFDGMCNTT